VPDAAVAEGEGLHHAVAVEPVLITEVADLVARRTVAVERAAQPVGQPAGQPRLGVEPVARHRAEGQQPGSFRHGPAKLRRPGQVVDGGEDPAAGQSGQGGDGGGLEQIAAQHGSLLH